MIKYILIFGIIFGCNTVDVIPIKEHSIEIVGVLNQSGIGILPIDTNGYYRLKHISHNQQPHRILGYVTENQKVPLHPQRFNWESNLYWWVLKGNTIATITKTYVNLFTGEFTVIELPPFISLVDDVVPTVNSVSYSNSRGEFNTIIAPIREMIGDTMIVSVRHVDSNKFQIVKIIIE
jgi:hypothetical protein